MSTLIMLLNKLIIFLHGLKVRSRPDNVLPQLEDISTDDIDPRLLSVGLDDRGNPRIVYHLDGADQLSKLVDEDTLKMLDADWEEATTADTG